MCKITIKMQKKIGIPLLGDVALACVRTIIHGGMKCAMGIYVDNYHFASWGSTFGVTERWGVVVLGVLLTY